MCIPPRAWQLPARGLKTGDGSEKATKKNLANTSRNGDPQRYTFVITRSLIFALLFEILAIGASTRERAGSGFRFLFPERRPTLQRDLSRWCYSTSCSLTQDRSVPDSRDDR